MRAVFTPQFFSPQPADTQSTSAPAVLAPDSIRYDEQRYGSVDAFMRHADFEAFKQHFIGLIDEVITFAHDHADQLTPPVSASRLQAITTDFETFKRHLFNAEQNFYSRHTALMYGVGFDTFEQLGRLLQDERIGLQRRMDTVINLAPDTTVCAGGCVTGLQNALGMLKQSGRGIIASAHRLKKQMVENAALHYVRRHHRFTPDFTPDYEVHYANAYLNFSADAVGIAPRPDPFARAAEGDMSLELLNDFKQSVRKELRPIALVEAMADDYASQITQVAQTDAAGIISVEQISATQQRIEALQTTTLDAEYGPVPLHDLLVELPTDGCYQLVKPPTLVAVRLMERLKKEKLVEFDPIQLAKAIDGETDLLCLDGLLWLNRQGQHEPLDVAMLCRALPSDMLAGLTQIDPLNHKKHLTIFCDVAKTLAALPQADRAYPLPDGWLTNFVGVSRELSGARQRELSTRLLDLSLHYDDAGAVTAMLETGLDKDAILANGCSIATVAASRDSSNVLRILLQRSVDIETGTADGASPLMAAANTGSVTSLMVLLEGGACIDAKSDEGKTAMMLAARQGNANIVDLLLKGGASVDAVTQLGDTALMLAVNNDNADVLQLLVDAGANVDARGRDGLTALMMAAYWGRASALETLLRARASPDVVTDEEQLTALMFAAGGGHLAAVNVLLAAGAPVSARDTRGYTALMLAAIAGHEVTVNALLTAGTDTECRTVDKGCTALVLAAMAGHEATVKLLLNAGAQIDSRALHGMTALMQVAIKGKHAVLITLLDAGASIELRATTTDHTALMEAAIHNDTESLRLLLDAGADIEAATRTGQTALAQAAHEGSSAAMIMLAARGACTECRTSRGFTPLMLAAYREQFAAIDALMAAGASQSAVAPDGRTAGAIVREAYTRRALAGFTNINARRNG